jgi:hypothetical protein
VAGHAGAAPAPAPFARRGTIDQIDHNSRTIVINDAVYILPAATRVYLPESTTPLTPDRRKERVPGTVLTLQKGMHIGFNVEDEGPGRKGRITEAWVLPRGRHNESQE